MGILNFYRENGATTHSLRYKIILEHQENKSPEFLKGTTHDLSGIFGNENART